MLMVLHEPSRKHLLNLLTENHYNPLVMGDPTELQQALKGQNFALVFIDCEAVTSYGGGLYGKVKGSCPRAKIIFFGHRSHLQDKSHRDLVKEAMDMGVYACLLAPYNDWEVLSMVKHILLKENASALKKAKRHNAL